MHEFRVGDHSYRSGKMNARQQFHVGRRLAPLIGQLASVAPVMSGLAAARQAAMEGDNQEEVAETTRATENMLVPFTRALASMTDADCDYVLDRCLTVVQRLSGGNGAGGWADIFHARTGRLAFEDIDLMQMIQIAADVLMDNLGGFFATPLPVMQSPDLPEQSRSAA